jgi:hypothetical protein
MALTMLPESPVCLSDARDWSLYEDGLAHIPLARKYLGETLRSWVEESGIPNPLVLPWVRALYDGTLLFLERHLEDLEATLGVPNLEDLLDDLLRKTGPALDLRRDVAALYGEIVAFRGLRYMGAKSIQKVTTRGDWHADGVDISVKTILGIDHNYQQIEDSLEGNGYLEECPTLRRMRHIQLQKGRGLDNELMTKALRLLDHGLERLLAFLLDDFGYPDWYHFSLEGLRIPGAASMDESGKLSLKAMRYDERSILLVLEDIRAGESSDSVGHGLEMEFEVRDDDAHAFSTNNDLNAWWGMPEIDQKRLGKQIASKVEEIMRKRRQGSPLAGWINIEMHPSLQKGIAAKPESLGRFVSEWVGKCDIPLLVHALGGFELARPVTCSFGPPLDFTAR